jgi:hypothetical protein
MGSSFSRPSPLRRFNFDVNDRTDDPAAEKLFKHNPTRNRSWRPLPPLKTTLAAVFMLIFGTIFLFAGTFVYFEHNYSNSDRGVGMFVLGLLSECLDG